MKIYLPLIALLGFVIAKDVLDLDDQAQLADISANGLKFEESSEEINLKVASTNDISTGQKWIVDQQACNDVINIQARYVYYPPEDDLAGIDVGTGEEIFTLTANSAGECTFRIAYATEAEFVSFEDYANQNGKIIEISITVPDFDNSEEEIECDPVFENCELKKEFGITKKVERNFKIMGIQAWIRGFSGLNLFSFLPQAITWTRAKNGNIRAAERFLWLTKWWTHIFGWFSSLSVLWAGMLCIELFYMGPGSLERGKKLLAPQVGDHKPGLLNLFWSDRKGDLWLEIFGWFVWFVEFACWFMFYWTYKDAKKYAEYLIASSISQEEAENEINPL